MSKSWSLIWYEYGLHIIYELYKEITLKDKLLSYRQYNLDIRLRLLVVVAIIVIPVMQNRYTGSIEVHCVDDAIS
jgi:hypothetical protein